ncbi:MAG: FAD-dependent oxidoreductase [Phycisphaeraceae bacterium]
MYRNLRQVHHKADVCVVGGGMAGLCAAIASARRGASTVLMHDRPMFGGNASSEVRMWICGAHGEHNKETGILEELQLENLHLNPGLNYPQWDGVMYAAAFFQPGLTPLLNCSCLDAEMHDASGHAAEKGENKIASVTGWQLTSQTYHTVKAKTFIDCSGDSILAPLTGAACRWGRESCREFGEDIEPEEPDRRTMGNSLLIQLRRTDEPQPFTPPKWAYKFEKPEDMPYRLRGVNPHNFWWIEIGGINNTIHDAEWIRDELVKVCYGVWDYIKNRAPEREQAAHWELYWIGRHPGKRENRRYEGDHILTQHDVEAGGPFEDTVAFGGWTMDDHHPAGLLYPDKPTIFHPAPSPYGIPYRCLYSRDTTNLMFAGRNISVTHAALSSTRVMATCAVLGQAAGTAAALAIHHDTSPRGVYQHHLDELQQQLMDDDCFLPGFTRNPTDLARSATLRTTGDGGEKLLDGFDRDRPEEPHAWEGKPGDAIEFAWDHPTRVGMLRCTFDSNLNHDKRLPCAYPVKTDRIALPKELVRSYRVEVRNPQGQWETVARENANIHRVVRIRIERDTSAVRFVPESNWGGTDTIRIFAVEPAERYENRVPEKPEGERFADVRARQSEADMAPPAKEQLIDRRATHGA